MTITETINSVSSILQYFVPGFLGIKLFCYINRVKIAHLPCLIFSCAISYITISVLNIFPNINKNISVLGISGLSSIIIIALTFIISFILNCEKIQNFIILKTHDTLRDDYWEDGFDFKNGMNIKIYPKNEYFYVIGNLSLLSSYNSTERWLGVSNFGKYDRKTNDPILNEVYLKDDSACFNIRMSDIEYIETF